MDKCGQRWTKVDKGGQRRVGRDCAKEFWNGNSFRCGELRLRGEIDVLSVG